MIQQKERDARDHVSITLQIEFTGSNNRSSKNYMHDNHNLHVHREDHRHHHPEDHQRDSWTGASFGMNFYSPLLSLMMHHPLFHYRACCYYNSPRGYQIIIYMRTSVQNSCSITILILRNLSTWGTSLTIFDLETGNIEENRSENEIRPSSHLSSTQFKEMFYFPHHTDSHIPLRLCDKNKRTLNLRLRMHMTLH